MFDAAGFFHQWLVRLIDRYKFTVVSYRGRKQFNITIMGFKIHHQCPKKIDVILRVHREFARVYVDDIIIFSHILEKHISNLHSIFQLFESYGIILSFKKCILNYPAVVLLN